MWFYLGNVIYYNIYTNHSINILVKKMNKRIHLFSFQKSIFQVSDNLSFKIKTLHGLNETTCLQSGTR